VVQYYCFSGKTGDGHIYTSLNGMVALLNHNSKTQNCKQYLLPREKFRDVAMYVSSRNIKKGEEILINYAEGGNEIQLKYQEIKHGIIQK
jgi:SET domain-containing protein